MKELRRTILEYLVQIPRFNKDKVISIWAKLENEFEAKELINWLKIQDLNELNYTQVNNKVLEIIEN
jgi:hypothetical protein